MKVCKNISLLFEITNTFTFHTFDHLKMRWSNLFLFAVLLPVLRFCLFASLFTSHSVEMLRVSRAKAKTRFSCTFTFDTKCHIVPDACHYFEI